MVKVIKEPSSGHSSNINKIKGVRFSDGEYEYRLDYKGNEVYIERRYIGGQKYMGFGRVDIRNCWSYADVVKKVVEKIEG